MIFDIITELCADFSALFQAGEDGDYAVYGAALLMLGLCFRLFWLLALPAQNKK